VFDMLKEDFRYDTGGGGAHCETVSLGYGGVIVSEVVLVCDCIVPGQELHNTRVQSIVSTSLLVHVSAT
jgi:hypothetical protein